MKSKLFFFIYLFFVCKMFASVAEQSERLTNPYFIASSLVREDVKNLNNLNVSIDSVNENGIIVYLNLKQKDDLKKFGYELVALRNEARDYNHDPKSLSYQYLTYSQYIEFMYEIATEYSDICSLHIAGYSVENREILFLKLSLNPDSVNPKPTIHLTSTIHGDEVVGYDLMIRLIQLITSGYNNNEEITELLNSFDIWICPLTNPDGYVAQERQNANGIDLNRHFPDFLNDNNNTTEGREPEIIALMTFALENKTHLSANFHGGAVVMNYPWDTTYNLFPDNDLVIDLALAYATLNPQMTNSTQFPNGITNGAQWYVIHGSLQDWDNYFNQVFHITAEVSQNKWPNPSQLESFWNYNKNSIINYIKRANRGFSGIVTNVNNEPLYASVQLANSQTVYTNEQNGYFNRLLLPGTYNFLISAYGYDSLYLEDIVVTADNNTFMEITLQELNTSVFSGFVLDNAQVPLENIRIKILDTPYESIHTDNNGFFELEGIYLGDYSVVISKNDMDYLFEISIIEENNHYYFVLDEPIFYDDFENNNNLWTLQGNWHYQVLESNTVLSDSPNNYASNINNSAILDQSFNLSVEDLAVAGFKTKYSLENNYDFAYFEVLQNTQWVTLERFTGNSDWINKSYNLSNFAGENVKFRFRISTDATINQEGIFIDDFYLISGTSYTNTFFDSFSNLPGLPEISHYPNPVYSSKIYFFSKSSFDEDVSIDIFNIKGQKVKTVVFNKNTKNLSIPEHNLSSGIYLYRISYRNQHSKVNKMLILQ